MGETAFGFGRAKKGTPRPMSGEEGSYRAFTFEPDEPDVSTSVLDASQFPDESHPLLQRPIGERIKKKATGTDLGAPAVRSALFPPNPTGYAIKHDGSNASL